MTLYQVRAFRVSKLPHQLIRFRTSSWWTYTRSDAVQYSSDAFPGAFHHFYYDLYCFFRAEKLFEFFYLFPAIFNIITHLFYTIYYQLSVLLPEK